MVNLSESPLLRPLFNRSVLLVTVGVGILYLFLQIYAFNARLFLQTVLDPFPLSYKLILSLELIKGYFLMFPLSQLVFSLLTALLVGLNLSLVIALMQRVTRSNDLKVSFGGTSLIALVSTGCPSCGLTALSFLGPSSGLALVILHSLVAQGVIIGILFVSIFYSLKRLEKSLACRR